MLSTRSCCTVALTALIAAVTIECGSTNSTAYPSGNAGTGGTSGNTDASSDGQGGSAGTSSLFDVSQCTPQTCASQHISCGPAADGCGGGVDADGGPVAGQCGCTGMCSQLPDCESGTTTLTGTVYDPAGLHPLYNVLVYVPNSTDPLPAFGPLTCDQCGAEAAGDPLVTTYTAPDGTFTLSGVPVGDNINVVIQLGRWRRQFPVSIANSCDVNTVPDKTFKMPSTQAQGDIPQIAISTGYIDAMECVLYKMGVAASEFTNPNGTGRIHLYKGSGTGTSSDYGEIINSSTPDQSALFATVNGQQVIYNYDMVIFACQGTQNEQSAANKTSVLNYANAGGRVFASHYSYTWLYNNGAFANTAKWNLNYNSADSVNATVDTNVNDNPKGPDFLAWLRVVGAVASTSTTISIASPRWDTDNTISPTQQWIYANTKPLHFTFNTPIGADAAGQCGRVLFSDFHVAEANDTDVVFPGACGTGAMTPNELALEFMIFDLGSCVQPYAPVCTPLSCVQQGIQCGSADDGCGDPLDCGPCPSGYTCGLVSPGQCGKVQ